MLLYRLETVEITVLPNVEYKLFDFYKAYQVDIGDPIYNGIPLSKLGYTVVEGELATIFNHASGVTFSGPFLDVPSGKKDTYSALYFAGHPTANAGNRSPISEATITFSETFLKETPTFNINLILTGYVYTLIDSSTHGPLNLTGFTSLPEVDQVGLVSAGLPLFTESNDTVNFNALKPNQLHSIVSGADVTKSLGGTDIIILPSQASIDVLAASGITDSATVAEKLMLLKNTPIYTGAGDSSITGSGLPAIIAGIDSGATHTGETGKKAVVGGGGDVKVLFPGQQSAYLVTYSQDDILSLHPQLGILIEARGSPDTEHLSNDVTAVFTDSDGLAVLTGQQMQSLAGVKLTFDAIKKTMDGLGKLPGGSVAQPYLKMFNFMLDIFSAAAAATVARNGYKYLFVESLQALIDADRQYVDNTLERLHAPSFIVKPIDDYLKELHSFAGSHGGEIYDKVMAAVAPAVERVGSAVGDFWQLIDSKMTLDFPILDSLNPTDEPSDLPDLQQGNPDQIDLPDGTLHLSGDPLVDGVYYAATNLDVFAAGIAAGSHYAQYGWHESRNPNPWFDTKYYLTQNPDVKAAGIDPLLHYEMWGWKEGRDPSLLFSSSKYLGSNADVGAVGIDPLLHYVSFGQSEGRMAFLAGPTGTPDPLVAAGYYDTQLGATLIPDGSSAQAQAAADFHASGWQKGLNPNPYFDTAFYLSHSPDVAAAHIDSLLHYETFGWHEGRDPSARFSTSHYLGAYSDVKEAGVNPLQHFLQFGSAEGRAAFPA